MANIRMSRINGEIQKAIAEVVNNRLNNYGFISFKEKYRGIQSRVYLL